MPVTQQLNHAQSISKQTTFPISIIANDIEIAGNVGNLFRTADALGVEKLYLTGSTKTPPRYKIRKAARSTEHHVPYDYAESALAIVETLKAKGYTIVALEISNQSVNIRQFKVDSGESIGLIIGSENTGISPTLLNQAQHHLHIPMYGKNSSMNVITSCAIAIHELIQHFLP